MLIHASCVLFCGKGVLLTGESGSGKSDLALRLIESGGVLVSDDETDVFCDDKGVLKASAPEKLQGLLEIRHIGIFRFPFEKEAQVAAVFRLLPENKDIPRLPDIQMISYFQKEEQDEPFVSAENTLTFSPAVPFFDLHPFESSAVCKIKTVLKQNGLPLDMLL